VLLSISAHLAVLPARNAAGRSTATRATCSVPPPSVGYVVVCAACLRGVGTIENAAAAGADLGG